MPKISEAQARFVVISISILAALSISYLLFETYDREYEYGIQHSVSDKVILDSHQAGSADGEDMHSRLEAEIRSAAVATLPERNDGLKEILSLFGLDSNDLDGSASLEDIYIDSETEAPVNSDAAWKAATIRKNCDFSAGIAESGEDVPDIYTTIADQCLMVDQVAAYKTWELIEFAASNGNFDAAVAQLSFPPPYSALQTGDDLKTAEQWNELVFSRIRRAADSGHPGAMLKAAEIYAGLHNGNTNYALAEMYLERLSYIPDLTPYQKGMALNLLELTRSSKSNGE